MMECKQKLMSGALEDLRATKFQDIRVWDERISAEEIDLLETKQAMKEFLKERRKTKVQEWRPGVGLPGWQQLGLESPKSSSKRYRGQQVGLEAPRRMVISFCLKVEDFQTEILRSI